MAVELEAEVAAEDVLAEVTGRARFGERLFEALVRVPDLAVRVVVADRDAHRVPGDDHAFDDDVRVVAQEIAILERAGLAFVRIAHEIFRAGVLLGHEAPFEARRKAGAAAPRSAEALTVLITCSGVIFSSRIFRSA